MLRRKTLSEEDAKRAMEAGDFVPALLRSAPCVAVILTQGWCSDWLLMSRWLDRLIETGQPNDLDLDVYQLVYDRLSFFPEFLAFKEGTFGNYQIPYVRYYADGVFQGDSNSIQAVQFLERFRRLGDEPQDSGQQTNGDRQAE